MSDYQLILLVLWLLSDEETDALVCNWTVSTWNFIVQWYVFFFLKMSFKPLCHYIIIIKIQKSLTLYQYFLMWPHSNPLFILSRVHLMQHAFTFTFHFHALEKEMATHFSVLAWRIPGMGEPGGLLSMGLHRVGHDWSDLAAAFPELKLSLFLAIYKVEPLNIIKVLSRATTE